MTEVGEVANMQIKYGDSHLSPEIKKKKKRKVAHDVQEVLRMIESL